MPECIACGSYTKFQKGKCYDCYQNSNENIGLNSEIRLSGFSIFLGNRIYHLRIEII